MPTVKIVINAKDGKSYQKEMEPGQLSGIFGKAIGEEFDGGIIGVPGYKLQITGGTDRDGFPMRKDMDGQGRKRILLAGRTTGYKPIDKGVRKRKMIRGNTIAEDIAQVNSKILKEGKESLAKLFGKEEAPSEEKPAEKKTAETGKKEAEVPEEKKAETPKQEEVKEEPKEEQKSEEKPAEEKEVVKEEKTGEAEAEKKPEAEEKKEEKPEEKKD